MLGGVISILVRLYVLNIAINKSIIMFSYEEPYLSTIERNIEMEEDEHQTFKWADNKAMLNIWEGEGNNPFAKVDLNRDSRRFIHVRLNNVVKEYNAAGVETRSDIYYPFK